MEQNNLENDIARIERELAVKRAELERRKTNGEIEELPREKETLHQMIGEQIRHSGGALPEQPASPVPPHSPTAQRPLTGTETPSYMDPAMNEKVRGLIDAAFKKSIDEAVKLAIGTGNAALIDAFHDALVDELYDSLVEYRKLKKI